jgi:hypothetical protein
MQFFQRGIGVLDEQASQSFEVGLHLARATRTANPRLRFAGLAASLLESSYPRLADVIFLGYRAGFHPAIAIRQNPLP